MMTELEIKKAIGDVEANFALEGMYLTDEDRARLQRIGRGESTMEEEIEKLNKKYLKAKVLQQ